MCVCVGVCMCLYVCESVCERDGVRLKDVLLAATLKTSLSFATRSRRVARAVTERENTKSLITLSSFEMGLPT